MQRADVHVTRMRRGAALLEALVALTMLVTVGTGMITLLGQTVETTRETHARDEETRAAGEILERLSVLDPAELRVRAGVSRLPCCTLSLQIQSNVVFDVELADPRTGAVILRTTIYAPEATRADAS